MEITQLHYFKTVAQYENFTLAAEKLHITQSALSRSIQALEKDIGFLLFERVGNRIHLNSNGVFFLSHVKEVLNILEHTVEETKSMAGLETGVIRFAVSETVFIKNIVYDFLLDYPDTRIQYQVLADDQILTSLEEGTISFAITRNPIIGPELVWKQIFSDRMMVMLPQGHPLKDQKYLHMSQLKDEHFIISNIGYQMQSEVLDLCYQAGFSPYITFQGHGEDLAGLLVERGLGVMLAPYSISIGVKMLRIHDMGEAASGIPLLDDFAIMPIGIVSRTKRFQSAAAIELEQRIIRYYSNLPPLLLQDQLIQE